MVKALVEAKSKVDVKDEVSITSINTCCVNITVLVKNLPRTIGIVKTQ